MKKYLFSFFVAGILILPFMAKADTPSLPTEDDSFWGVMSSLTAPDDAACVTKAGAYYDANLIPYFPGQLEATCTGISQIMSMESTLASSGITTNLFEKSDWHNITGLYFEATGLGKIEFTNSIDFMSYNFLTFISTFSDRIGMSQGEIGLDADIVGGMAGYGAVLTMYNAGDFSNPTILVNNEIDTEGVVSGLTYDQTTHDITFDASHFTTFTATDSPAEDSPVITTTKKPHIKKASAEKITRDDGIFVKMTIIGKNFNSDTKAYLGGVKSFKINRVSSKKIIAYFKVFRLEKTGKTDFYLKLKNDSKKTSFNDAFKLSLIK